jgi:hypothetical protein
MNLYEGPQLASAPSGRHTPGAVNTRPWLHARAGLTACFTLDLARGLPFRKFCIFIKINFIFNFIFLNYF